MQFFVTHHRAPRRHGSAAQAGIARGLALGGALVVVVLAGACATVGESSLSDVVVEPVAPALDRSHPLTLDEVGRAAVLRNPALLSARAAIGVKRAIAARAGTWPDPNLNVSFAQPLFPDPGQATLSDTALGAALGVDWDVGSLITKGAEHREAVLDADSATLALRYQELAVAGEARLAAAKVASLERQAALAEEARKAMQGALETTLDARQAGDATVDDVGVREVAALEAEARAYEINASLAEAREDLARSLGVGASERVEVAPPGLPPDLAGGVDDLAALARRQRGDLIALERAYESHEAALDAAVLGQFPHLSISLEAAHDPAAYTSAGGGASISLPVFDGNRGTVAVERATRDQLRAEYAQRLFEVRADIAKILAARDRAKVQRAALVARVPRLQAAAAVLAKAASEHNATALAYVEVETARVDAELRLLALDEDEIEQRLALQTALGAPAGSSPTTSGGTNP